MTGLRIVNGNVGGTRVGQTGLESEQACAAEL